MSNDVAGMFFVPGIFQQYDPQIFISHLLRKAYYAMTDSLNLMFISAHLPSFSQNVTMSLVMGLDPKAQPSASVGFEQETFQFRIYWLSLVVPHLEQYLTVPHQCATLMKNGWYYYICDDVLVIILNLQKTFINTKSITKLDIRKKHSVFVNF